VFRCGQEITVEDIVYGETWMVPELSLALKWISVELDHATTNKTPQHAMWVAS